MSAACDQASWPVAALIPTAAITLEPPWPEELAYSAATVPSAYAASENEAPACAAYCQSRWPVASAYPVRALPGTTTAGVPAAEITVTVYA